ncbi:MULTISPECIES: GAF domain-containing protein [unclassified Sphingomonas]|uniref:GAF domain-containing protein n=1 Tax=unclassified Sphingomonas TaxID=196159 RepID=UPI002151DA5D|nr:MULTISPECIES: GAF domain-containing protein [unclassified Sphingomonas]MCR5869297.1 GAF domain-containing protein [Sphingomonas sp. J344]UUX98971.1 GAF domain-containing protein [Sphingomonas sp. J315]
MTVPDADDVPLSSEDALRRAALFASGLLALRESPQFAELLEELTEALDAPIGGVSLIDRGYCWLPVLRGIELDAVPLADSLCVEVVETLVPMAEPDLPANPQFAHNRFVAGPLALRAYAAVPLCGVQGAKLGTLFVADRRVRRDFADHAIPRLERTALRILDEAAAPHHMRRVGRTTVEGLEALIRRATRDGDDGLVTAIDRLMRDILPLTGVRES